jgi:hypothetical protein
MSEPARLPQVVAWLSDLANITAGNAPLADSKAKIGTLATMLAAKFPTEAFGRVSLDYVAQECRFFPAYADLIKHLGIWWRDHRPAEALPGAGAPDRWSQKVAAEHSEAVEDWTNPMLVRSAIRSLIDHPMRGVLGPMLGSLVGRHAPQNQGMLPPEWLVSGDAPAGRHDKPAPVTPCYLSPEQIAVEKARAAAHAR